MHIVPAAFNVGSQYPLEEFDYPTYDPSYHKRSMSHKHWQQPSIPRHRSRQDHLDHAPFEEQLAPHFVCVVAGSKGWRQHTRRCCLVCNTSCCVPRQSVSKTTDVYTSTSAQAMHPCTPCCGCSLLFLFSVSVSCFLLSSLSVPVPVTCFLPSFLSSFLPFFLLAVFPGN